MFISSSQQCSPRVFPIAARFNKSSPSHPYRWAKGRGGTPSFHTIFYFGGVSNISIFFGGQPNGLIKKKKKGGLVRHPQLINMKPAQIKIKIK